MALEPNSGRRSVSPVSSGRTSPAIRYGPRAEDGEKQKEVHCGYSLGGHYLRVKDDVYKKDKSYRRYASGIERSLSLFDTALQEWADYISFLGRLLKVPSY